MNFESSYGWWDSLKHGGMLIAPSKLPAFFPQSSEPVSENTIIKLRKALTQLSGRAKDIESEALHTVLVDLCGINQEWKKAGDVGKEYSLKALTGETIRPRWILDNPQYTLLPVFVDTSVKRIGIGKGRRTYARTVEWLRGKGEKIALLTNLFQWRLVYAGMDFDAWVQWDTDLWFEEGKTSAQLEAMRILISQASFRKNESTGLSSIIEAIQESRKGQAELSSELGERVRLAVELLIQDHSRGLQSPPQGVTPKEIYLAATRMVMRMVVALFAEARDLLPRDNSIYHSSYGLQGLLECLEKTGSGRGKETLKYRSGAWPRIISLCRLIFAGSGHQALPVPRYGGDLFRPGDSNSEDILLRAVAIFETPDFAASDATVYEMLKLLCRSRIKVRQGKQSITVEAPVDFSDLSSEYIGILYEGLLDYELKRAGSADPIIFLNLGNQPALDLAVLEGMDDKALKNLVESMKVTKGKEDSESGDDNGEDSDDSCGDGENSDENEIATDENSGEDTDEYSHEENITDKRHSYRMRAIAWAKRAVIAAKIVKMPRGRKEVDQKSSEEALLHAAKTLVRRVIMPGEWYLVRWGGTRKGSGTFYTRPQLAVPTVHRTLRPLAFTAPAGEDGKPDELAPPQNWIPKKPEEILALKVCDPAMGSGSFPVAALRFLTDALMQSLYFHERIKADGERTLVTLAEGKESSGSLREEYLPCRPDADDFDARLKARLKRYVVEECIYGVDLDPLAVELARLALWIETMDRDLPFEFLDHKLKAGNSLVGCWMNRFRNYPVMAWMREGGDGSKGPRTQKITEIKKGRILSELNHYISLAQSVFDSEEFINPLSVHKEALSAIKKMGAIPVHRMEERANYYKEHILHNEHIRKLKNAFDTWCAVWFWPVNDIDKAPGPRNFLKSGSEWGAVLNSVVNQYRFFHWELEFPDVFAGEKAGFDAVIGNPPWEIQKPISKEYFSNIDPLYRSYGKQEALRKQAEYFESDPGREDLWMEYNARFKALSNWCKYVFNPFGDPQVNSESFSFGSKKLNADSHNQWRNMRLLNEKGTCIVKDIPFQHQGSADLNTYKMFLEFSYTLLKDSGMCGMIVPSGIYSDKGTGELRKLFLNRCDWKWIFSFENKNKIFDIHRSFKFGPLIFSKGRKTTAIKTSFMRHNLEDWENGENYITWYKREQVEKFSPWSLSLLEINSEKDIEILDTIYSNSVLLGDDSPGGWGIKYATEFHMTNDSKLFPPRPVWEEKGYKPDEYGRWIGPDGDVALPLYQGIMVNQLNPNRAVWLSGSGLNAIWNKESQVFNVFGPQYLISSTLINNMDLLGKRILVRTIARTTDARTLIGATCAPFPSGNSLSAIVFKKKDLFLYHYLSAILNSFVFDWSLRQRLGGTNVNKFFMEEMGVLPRKDYHNSLLKVAFRIECANKIFAPDWLLAQQKLSINSYCQTWKSHWAVTDHEKTRLRCIIDSIVAGLYGLSLKQLKYILYNVDDPDTEILENKLSPKGFWRVDKDKPPELRHTVLSLVAFNDLQKLIDENRGDREKGIEAFCNLNNGEGWMLPEKLRLADYGLGHDDRAKEYQPVAEKFGPRFYDWQLEQTPEESWEECERHARNILGEEGFEKLQAELRGEIVEEVVPEPINYLREDKGKYGEQLSLL